MKVKVIRNFFDKQSREIRQFGNIIDINDKRYQELNGFVKKIEKNNSDNKNNTQEQA